MGSYTIGEVAKNNDLSIRTLQWYDQIGLLKPAYVGNARIYQEEQLRRLAVILQYKKLGIPLAKIKATLDKILQKRASKHALILLEEQRIKLIEENGPQKLEKEEKRLLKLQCLKAKHLFADTNEMLQQFPKALREETQESMEANDLIMKKLQICFEQDRKISSYEVQSIIAEHSDLHPRKGELGKEGYINLARFYAKQGRSAFEK